MQWYDWWRLITAILTLLVIYRLAHRLNDRARNFSRPTKEWSWVIFVALTLSFEACVEGLVEDSPFAWRIPLEFILMLAGLRATRYSDEPLEYYK
jgi:hypothetical protein